METAHDTTDPASRSMESWRATLGVLASRGETSGPRVDQAEVALSWHRCARLFAREVDAGHLSAETAAKMLDQLRK